MVGESHLDDSWESGYIRMVKPPGLPQAGSHRTQSNTLCFLAEMIESDTSKAAHSPAASCSHAKEHHHRP